MYFFIKKGNRKVLQYHIYRRCSIEYIDNNHKNNLNRIKINRLNKKYIKKEFIETSGILENDINTKYNIEKKEKEYTLLSYENLNMKIIKVPNALIPYWAKENEKLYYKNGKFNREI